MHRFTRKIGLILGPVVAAMGLAAISLAGAGPASAASIPGVVYGNPVTLSVTIPNSTTLTINPGTESINFGSPSVLPALLGPANSTTGSAVPYSGPGAPTSTAVKGTVVSNDENGYTVQASGNDSPWGQVTTASIAATADTAWQTGYAAAINTEPAGYKSNNGDTGATGLPAVTCNESSGSGGPTYNVSVKRVAENWQAAPANSTGSLYSSSAYTPPSGASTTGPTSFVGQPVTTVATGTGSPVGNLFVAGVDNINDGSGMAEAPTCASTASGSSTLYGQTSSYVANDTFSTAGYLPWTDLSVVGNAGTSAMTSVSGVGSSTVNTDSCVPVGGATSGQSGYCGPDGSGSDQIGVGGNGDLWSLNVPGNQSEGQFYGNLGYSVLSN